METAAVGLQVAALGQQMSVSMLGQAAKSEKTVADMIATVVASSDRGTQVDLYA